MHYFSSWKCQASSSTVWIDMTYIKVLLVNCVHLAAILATQHGSYFQLFSVVCQKQIFQTNLKWLLQNWYK